METQLVKVQGGLRLHQAELRPSPCPWLHPAQLWAHSVATSQKAEVGVLLVAAMPQAGWLRVLTGEPLSTWPRAEGLLKGLTGPARRVSGRLH